MPALLLMPLRADALPELEKALRAAALPCEDLEQPGRFFFRFVTPDGDTAGYGGLEPCGDSALLRSVAVTPAMRGGGKGAALLACLTDHARAIGIKRLWLLTTTAEGFFAKHGFQRIDRTAAPDAISRTVEFTTLCPVSAVCMVKEI